MDEDNVKSKANKKKVAKGIKRKPDFEQLEKNIDLEDNFVDEDSEVVPPIKVKKLKKEKSSTSTIVTVANSSSQNIEVNDETNMIPQIQPMSSSSVLTSHKFADLPIGEKTKNAIHAMGFKFMTQIQAKSIPECLSGSDLVGAAKVNS